MEENNAIVNRVALSPLVSFNLEELYHPGPRITLDIKKWLFQGIILKEKDFREHIKAEDWSIYHGANVAIRCSVDAIIPLWAWMLVTIHLSPFAHKVVVGDLLELEHALFQDAINSVDLSLYHGKKVVIKGCSNVPVPAFAYVELTTKLLPIAESLMFGEPCSTVPLFKKSKKGS
jgi:hypothetical protein